MIKLVKSCIRERKQIGDGTTIMTKLQQLKTNLKTFAVLHAEQSKQYAQKRKEINERYLQAFATEKLNQLMNDYQAIMAEARSEGVMLADKAFIALRDELTSKAMESPNDKFFKDIEAIKLSADVLSQTEIDFYIEKYKNNYIATKGILNALNTSKAEIQAKLMSLDDILGHVANVQSAVYRFYYDYKPGTYETEVVTYDKEGLLDKLEAMTNLFISGNYNKADYHKILDVKTEQTN